MKVLLATLGCPKNTVDSECMASLMTEAGHELVDSPARADLIVVNTCGFIEAARQESIETLRELSQGKRRNQLLVAAGCLAQRWGERLVEVAPAIDGVLFGYALNIQKCIGCRRCVKACVAENNQSRGERQQI